MGHEGRAEAGREARRVRARRDKRRLLSLLIASTILGTASLHIPAIGYAQQQPAGQTVRFNIRAQPLSSAVNAFIRTTGWEVGFTSDAVAGKRSNPVNGTMTPAQALRTMLASTSVDVSISGPSTAALVSNFGEAPGIVAADGTTLLDPITIEGRIESAWGPVDGIVATQSATGTKSDTPILETPRAINVVTKEEIQARGGAQTYVDALSYTPGFTTINSANSRSNDVGVIRGFNIYGSLYLDGMALPTGLDRAQPQIEPYGMERIEVLKGPASVLYGQGSPGGLVNMVSKRPLFEPLREVQVQFGSFDRKQTAFDFSDKLDESGTFAYRLTGLLQDSGTQMDFVDDDRIYIAPAFTWKPSDDTTLTLLSHYRKNRGGDTYAILPTDIAAEVPTNRFPGEPGFDRNNTEQFAIGYEFNHRFSDVWQITQTGRYFQVDVDYRYLQGFDLTGNPDLPGEVSRSAYLLDERLRAWTSDTRVQADFEAGSLTHKFVAGLDYKDQRSDNRNGFYYGEGTPLDLFNPVYGTPQPDFDYAAEAHKNIRQVGLYAQEQIKWDRWILSFGGRHDWAEGTTDRGGGDVATASDTAFTGNVGLIYLFDNGLAPYASFAQSFQPQAGADVDNNIFEPTTGEQYEIGIKYQPPGFDALVTVSAFQLTQQGSLTTDLANPTFQKQLGETQVRGVEIEGKATFDSVDLIASYTHLDSEITRDNDGNLGNRVMRTPEHMASAWLNYRFESGVLEGLNLGAGVRYVGSSYGDNENTLLNKSAAFLDLSAGYDFGRRNPNLEGLRLDVSVINATDKKYLYCEGPWGCEWGKRLTALGTLSYRW